MKQREATKYDKEYYKHRRTYNHIQYDAEFNIYHYQRKSAYLIDDDFVIIYEPNKTTMHKYCLYSRHNGVLLDDGVFYELIERLEDPVYYKQAKQKGAKKAIQGAKIYSEEDYIEWLRINHYEAFNRYLVENALIAK